MRKLLFIPMAIAVLCSCEKTESFYVYEDVVPGTTIKESQLGKITHQEFLDATEGEYYTLAGCYPCIRSGRKVYYSKDKDDTPSYSGTFYGNIWRFKSDYLEQLEWWLGGNNNSLLSYMNYSYDGNVLSGILFDEIADSREYRVLYADKECLIFETDGKTDNKYNNEGAEFSRLIYTKSTLLDELYAPQDTVDLRVPM